MLDPAITAFVNHLLRSASWARDELKRHAGRTVRFENGPFTQMLTVLENGEVSTATADATPAVTILLTPGLMLRLAARDETVWRDIQVVGDADFAATINHLSHHLRWDVEEDLSRVFGDIAAHRMTQTGQTFGRWAGQALDNTGRAFAEYWTEERPLVAAGRDLDRFNRAVDELRDDVARFEKRIERLSGGR